MFKMFNMFKWVKNVSSYTTYTKLGRWKIDHDVKIINIKIDQANYDNGGYNGTYHFENTSDEKVVKNKEHDFLVPYCM